MYPLIPDLSGTQRPAAELHELAVYEAYTFCHERGLHRFWAYLGNEWLVYLLAKKVVGDVEISLKQFQKGRETLGGPGRERPVRPGILRDGHIGLVVFVPRTYRRFEPPFYVFQSEEEFFSRQTMRPESDPWYNHPPFAEHGLAEDRANDLPEDHGVGNFDLNEAEDPANGLHEDHGVRLFDLNEAAEEIIGDDNVEPDVHAEPNVAAIARHLAEVNVGVTTSLGKKNRLMRSW
ncbi:hypothetical protein R1sor_006629 [Riccia sorocarpa]|uniref:Uncharacterized protein n=1 Tax=Riccia sorocarpa TaxID=122646 RepID=A0ABD3HNH4_9MARC